MKIRQLKLQIIIGGMMKNKILLVILTLILALSLVAFAACADEEEEEEEVWQWPERMILGVSSTRGPTYGSYIAWSTPLSEDTGMTIRIIAEAEIELGQKWVKEGRFFGSAPHQNRACMYGQTGRASRDGGPWISSVWLPAGKAFWSACTLGDSGIKTPYDIKPGMKALMLTLAEEPQQFIFGVLAWGRVDPEDVTWVPCGSTAQVSTFVQDGRVDFSIGYTMQPTWYELEASPRGLTWMELDAENDPEGAQRFLDWYPYTGFGIADQTGPQSSWDVPMLETISPNVTRLETDPELVYRIVKWSDENYARYKDAHPWAADMNIDYLMKLAKEHYEPIHEGAVRYLEEKGLWTEELEARRLYNIEQLDLWVEAYQAAINMADDKGIVVQHDNVEWQELWENYRDSLNLPLLVFFQGPGKEQPRYSSYYDRWNQVRPFQD